MESKYNCVLDTRCPGRRLQKELTFKWTDEYQEKNNTFYHNTNSNTMTFFMFLENIKVPISIYFLFNDSTYPFRPPRVFIGKYKTPYTSLLCCQWNFALKIFGEKCPCCSTIVCRDNWGPSFNLTNITDEIRENLKKKIRVMEIFHCKKIIDKYFGHYIPIEEFL